MWGWVEDRPDDMGMVVSRWRVLRPGLFPLGRNMVLLLHKLTMCLSCPDKKLRLIRRIELSAGTTTGTDFLDW